MLESAVKIPQYSDDVHEDDVDDGGGSVAEMVMRKKKKTVDSEAGYEARISV